MSDREQRAQLKKWCRRQQVSTATRLDALVNSEASVTADESVVSSTVSSTPLSTRGQKRVQRNRSALYKQNLSLRQ